MKRTIIHFIIIIERSKPILTHFNTVYKVYVYTTFQIFDAINLMLCVPYVVNKK